MSMPGPADRPLSPFMLGSYYRFQLTSVLSLLHRVTGVGLTLGSLLLAGWLMAVAAGPQTYEGVARHLHAVHGQILLFAWTWSLMYHLCNGIRHLVWDVGRGFELKSVYLGGYLVVAGSLFLTAGVWGLAYVF